MKKNYVLCSAMAMSLLFSMNAYAGQWQQTGENWKYLNDDGSYAAQNWQWIDGNGDGIAESYCFDENGILYTNVTTPDGYQVNADGAWTVDGVVQTQSEESDDGALVTLKAGYNVKMPSGMECVFDYGHNNYRMARYEDAEGTRRIQFLVNDNRESARYWVEAEGETDAGYQEDQADAVGMTLKATVVLRDLKEYPSGTWSHAQLTDYVGDFQKYWPNVDYYFYSKDFVATSVAIWDTGVGMDRDSIMNSLTRNEHYTAFLNSNIKHR